MATRSAAPSSSARKRGRAARASSRASATDAPLLEEDDIETIVQHLASLAERSLGKMALGPLAPITPAVIGIVGRYARREPLRAALIAAGLAGLYYIGQHWLKTQSSELTEAPSAAG